MRARLTSVAVLSALLLASCGGDGDATGGASTIGPTTTAVGPTTRPTGTTEEPRTGSTDSAPSTEAPGSPVPPVTPPPGQPAACTVLAAAADLDPAGLEPVDDPAGQPAPSTGCRGAGVSLALFYGQDPLETLAVARVQNPVGSDATGVGQDAYESGGVLYVDTGSRAFAVSGGGRADLVALAQRVIDNL